MLGALSVISMRQKHDESGLTKPLVFMFFDDDDDDDDDDDV